VLNPYGLRDKCIRVDTETQWEWLTFLQHGPLGREVRDAEQRPGSMVTSGIQFGHSDFEMLLNQYLESHIWRPNLRSSREWAMTKVRRRGNAKEIKKKKKKKKNRNTTEEILTNKVWMEKKFLWKELARKSTK
jgi:hypothetical protein